jgi:predicted DNA-binding protein
MKALSVKLPDPLETRLAAAAKKRRVSKSSLVRDALEAFLEADGIQAGSALDVVRDLAGSIHGPGDLSYNKAHLRDFGRR